ncbi:putative nuclease HARBI1 [Aphis craccivora]|uniref:Putative nuclease HARBI1 n=1 Tax=Aphis craccivora TaxID=307492 RepID=A0A6G0YS64_APHCR|nr:putative nuclease HARBI1 [Aphis craccivora]
MDTSSSSSSDDECVIEFVSRLGRTRKPRIFRKRADNLIEWDKNAFYNRFRLIKRCVNIVLDLIAFKIESPTNRNHAVTSSQMILCTIRFLASGCMLITAEDFAGIHKTTAGKYIWKFCRQ